MHGSLIAAVTSQTQSQFLKDLFKEHDDQAMAEGKLNFISVGNKFKGQLTELLERLAYTGTNFVRCIKPNENMSPNEFNGPSILTQLQCAGMLSVLELMQQGYPSRAKFSVLYGLYEKYLPADLARLDPRFFCKGLFACLKMTPGDYRFGLSMVFFRPGKFAEFDALMREDPEHLKGLIWQVRGWLRKARWRKAQYFIWTCIRIRNVMKERGRKIVYLQALIRMVLVRRKVQPRIAALFKLSNMLCTLKEVRNENLVTESLQTAYRQLIEYGSTMRQTMLGHGDQSHVSNEWINSVLNTYSVNIDLLLKKADSEQIAKKKRQEEDRELRLRQKAEAEERQRQVAAEEAKAKFKAEEDNRTKIEQRRKEEEELIRNHRELLERAAADEIKKKREALLLRKKEEQIKIDFHLAQRLAVDTGSDVDAMTIIGLPASDNSKEILERQRKYNLTSWKYAQLRDTINTSCDVELLQACREEFHRRLKAYHVWKSRNKAKGAPVDRRVPSEIREAIKNMRTIVGSEAVLDNEQRYFKVSLGEIESSDQLLGSAWYAHFDGRWICRQLEVTRDNEARPMIAGIDDVDMCELRLDETDLTYRKGVEILESDFEKVWNAHGGLQYMTENFSKISSAHLRNVTSKYLNLMDL